MPNADDYQPNEGKPETGEISPLEGMVGFDGRNVCATVYTAMTLDMCRRLNMQMSNALEQAPGITGQSLTNLESAATVARFTETPDVAVSKPRMAAPVLPAFKPSSS